MDRLPSDLGAIHPPPALDLRGFLSLLKELGLLPAPIPAPGGQPPISLQYPLAVLAFKDTQLETGEGSELHWREMKHAIYRCSLPPSLSEDEQVVRRN